MAADAYRLKLRHARRPLIEALGIGVRDAELGFAQSRGDVRMRACIDVRVDAQRHRRAAHEAARNARDALELGFRLDVDAADPPAEREFDLGLGLADAGEERLAGDAARGEHARELTAG